MESDEDVPQTGPAKQRRVREAALAHETTMLVVKELFCELFNHELVDDAVKRVMKKPAVQAALAKVGAKTRLSSSSKGSGLCRSAYSAFVSVCFANLRGTEGWTMTDAASIWKGLPASQKQEISQRLTAVKEVYNAKVKAGQSDVSMAAELSAYEEEHGLEPFDYQAMLSHRAPPKTPGAAAAAAAATPATGKRPASDNEQDEDEDEEEEEQQQPQAPPKPTPKRQLAQPVAPAQQQGLEGLAAAPLSGGKHKKHKKDKDEKKEKKHKKDKTPGEKKKKEKKRERASG